MSGPTSPGAVLLCAALGRCAVHRGGTSHSTPRRLLGLEPPGG